MYIKNNITLSNTVNLKKLISTINEVKRLIQIIEFHLKKQCYCHFLLNLNF